LAKSIIALVISLIIVGVLVLLVIKIVR
jgi:hypothetical protein